MLAGAVNDMDNNMNNVAMDPSLYSFHMTQVYKQGLLKDHTINSLSSPCGGASKTNKSSFQQQQVKLLPQSPPRCIPKKPMRPLTAYHIFFQIEREYVIQTMDGEDADKTMHDKKVHLEEVPNRYKNIKLMPDWYAGPGKRQKRKHRKSHGKIGFLELSRVISSRWATLGEVDLETKTFVQKIAAQELEEYRCEMKQYKELTKRMNNMVGLSVSSPGMSPVPSSAEEPLDVKPMALRASLEALPMKHSMQHQQQSMSMNNFNYRSSLETTTLPTRQILPNQQSFQSQSVQSRSDIQSRLDTINALNREMEEFISSMDNNDGRQMNNNECHPMPYPSYSNSTVTMNDVACNNHFPNNRLPNNNRQVMQRRNSIIIPREVMQRRNSIIIPREVMKRRNSIIIPREAMKRRMSEMSVTQNADSFLSFLEPIMDFPQHYEDGGNNNIYYYEQQPNKKQRRDNPSSLVVGIADDEIIQLWAAQNKCG